MGEAEADTVLVHGPGGGIYQVTHEDSVDLLPNTPDDLKAYVRREVLRGRPLAENEKRLDDSVAQFRWKGGKLERRFLFFVPGTTAKEYWGPFNFDVDAPPDYLTSGDLELYTAARAWRDRQTGVTTGPLVEEVSFVVGDRRVKITIEADK